MAGKQTLSLWDYDKEVGIVSIPTVTIDETNLVLQAGYMDTFLTAIDGVSLGVVFKDTRQFEVSLLSGTPPADQNAQREKKWLVRMVEDVTFTIRTLEVPCADLSLLDAQARGQMDQSNPAYTLLKSAIENFYVTPNGNGVTVQEAIFVGRNT